MNRIEVLERVAQEIWTEGCHGQTAADARPLGERVDKTAGTI